MPFDKLDDRSARRPLVPPVCFQCAHWHEPEDTCDAFPDGIPFEIFFGGNKHTKPFKGDRGIRFEAKE